MTSKKLSFEQAFQRLEAILERLNAQDVTLEESLQLFEEANSHIVLCHKQLNDAERRIEILTKSRDGEIEMSSEKCPKTTPMDVGEGCEDRSIR